MLTIRQAVGGETMTAERHAFVPDRTLNRT
jgi:hypothetical protein